MSEKIVCVTTHEKNWEFHTGMLHAFWTRQTNAFLPYARIMQRMGYIVQTHPKPETKITRIKKTARVSFQSGIWVIGPYRGEDARTRQEHNTYVLRLIQVRIYVSQFQILFLSLALCISVVSCVVVRLRPFFFAFSACTGKSHTKRRAHSKQQLCTVCTKYTGKHTYLCTNGLPPSYYTLAHHDD